MQNWTKVRFCYHMKEMLDMQDTNKRLKFGDLKIVSLDFRSPFKVLTKFGIIFGHFTLTILNEMNARGILLSNRPYLQS